MLCLGNFSTQHLFNSLRNSPSLGGLLVVISLAISTERVRISYVGYQFRAMFERLSAFHGYEVQNTAMQIAWRWKEITAISKSSHHKRSLCVHWQKAVVLPVGTAEIERRPLGAVNVGGPHPLLPAYPSMFPLVVLIAHNSSLEGYMKFKLATS